MKERTLEQIKDKIARGEATVMTAHDLCDLAREGAKVTFDDVDVVTSATCGLMSGTAAVLSFTVAGRDVFRKAMELYLNGVPAFPGPAPNERLGVIDAIVYGTAHSRDNPSYGGGQLFRDIVDRKDIDVELVTDAGKGFSTTISFKDIGHAQLLGVRNAFKNYTGFLNIKDDKVKTIFHAIDMEGPYKGLTFSGCGEINPVENDPDLRIIGIGTRCLFNGAPGYITGKGTRASKDKPNLSIVGDMRKMRPDFVGGFLTSDGPEVYTSVAVPIPILNEEISRNVLRTDDSCVLPVADIHDRVPFVEFDYSMVWQHGVDLFIIFDIEACKDCEERNKSMIGDSLDCRCMVEQMCPTGAFDCTTLEHDKVRCFNCGLCVGMCSSGGFTGNLGAVEVDGRTVPVVLRQSNRFRAQQLASLLKKRIESGQFEITPKVEDFTF